MFVNQTAQRDGASSKEHSSIASRAFSHEIPVRGAFFSNAVFNHSPLEDFSQTDGNRLVGAQCQEHNSVKHSKLISSPNFSFKTIMKTIWAFEASQKESRELVDM